MSETISQRRGRGRPVVSRGFPTVHIRLPPDLYDQIIASAHEDFRSINNEMVRRLRMAYASANSQSGQKTEQSPQKAEKKRSP
jgi:hypothetical protein